MRVFSVQSASGSNADCASLVFRTRIGMSLGCCGGQYTHASFLTLGSGEFIMGGKKNSPDIPIHVSNFQQ